MGKNEISIEVRDPYPCWCDLMYAGERVASFRHDELADLLYATKRAMREAKCKLSKNEWHEIDD